MQDHSDNSAIFRITIPLLPRRGIYAPIQKARSILQDFNATNIKCAFEGLSVVITADDFPNSDAFRKEISNNGLKLS